MSRTAMQTRFSMFRMLAIAAVIVFYGCGDQAQQQRQPSGNKAGTGDVKPGKKPKPGGASDSTGPSDSTGSDSTSDDSSTPITSDGCASFSDNLAGPISAKGAAKAPIIGSINFTLEADAQFSLEANAQGAVVGLAATIKSFSPSIARSIADNVINSYKDPLKLTPVPAAELKAFHASTPGWQGLDCIVIPIRRIANSAYEYEFDPALPMLISPKASAADLSSKLGGGVKFTGIKSKLIRHFQPENVAKRGTYTGSASISGSGGTYRIAYDFGTKAPNALATPVAGIEYGITGGTGTYSSVNFSTFVADDSKIDLRLSK